MEKDDKQKKNPGAPPNNVVALPTRCPVDSCGKKPKKMHFCEEHYEWFKVGLITKKGEKPKDFDKKYAAFKRRKAA
tara:strand:+ start:739 stop:966 length:228 start_codon:yes stop_codon:yes gene_type:complete